MNFKCVHNSQTGEPILLGELDRLDNRKLALAHRVRKIGQVRESIGRVLDKILPVQRVLTESKIPRQEGSLRTTDPQLRADSILLETANCSFAVKRRRIGGI